MPNSTFLSPPIPPGPEFEFDGSGLGLGSVVNEVDDVDKEVVFGASVDVVD